MLCVVCLCLQLDCCSCLPLFVTLLYIIGDDGLPSVYNFISGHINHSEPSYQIAALCVLGTIVPLFHNNNFSTNNTDDAGLVHDFQLGEFLHNVYGMFITKRASDGGGTSIKDMSTWVLLQVLHYIDYR